MFKRSLSWFILVFTLLEFVVRTQLTAYDNSHGFISNNHDRYLSNELSSMQEELASDIRSATINKLNIKLQIKFDPEFLDFKQRPLGIPHVEKVTLINIDRNRSIDMTSISGNTVHFHSSFFEDKKIPPLGNTSFHVVFLGREEGAIESNLFIHTTEGHFKYQVKGASVYSPYRLRPIVGIKLPLNASFSPLIYIHNPHSESIQIIEIYSSGADFHLELPTGELEGPKNMWEILPLQTKAIIKVRFLARNEQNHTAYVRIKLNNTEEILVVPLEVEVTSNAVLFALQGYIDFGVGGSLDAPKQIKLTLQNPLKKAVKIQSITTTSKAIKINYDMVKVIANGRGSSVEVASLSLDWKIAYHSEDYSGKIIIKYKSSKARTEIPYYLTVVEGGLIFNVSTTRYFIYENPEKLNVRKMVVKNDFLMPIMLLNVSLPVEAQKFFHIFNYKQIVLKPKEEKAIFQVKVNAGVNISDLIINTHILIYTNISSFEIPLISYNGKLELHLPYKSKGNSLDLGLVSLENKKETYLLLLNKNPVTINLKQFVTSLPSSMVDIIGCGRGNYNMALLQESYKNMTFCISVKPGEYVILKLTIRASRSESQIWGDIAVQTQFEEFSIPIQYKAASGKLEIGPDRLVFDQCFPGKICSHPLRVHSTFADPMIIEGILSIPPDSRLSSRHSGHIMGRATKIIGHLYLDPVIGCQNECYLGMQQEITENWIKTLLISKLTTEFDLNLVNIFYNRYLNQTSNGLTKWQNLTMRLDTSEVKGHIFKTRVKMSWPSILADQTFENKTDYTFPLTQVGNITYKNITIKNPSSLNLLVQIIMDQFYPNFDLLFEGLPPIFIPNSMEPLRKPKHGFFIDKDSMPKYDKYKFSHQEDTFPVMIKPNGNVTFRVGFKAFDAVTNSAFLFLRNNLTVLEVIKLMGKGAYPNFKFGNRKPGSQQPLAFELTEKHLKDCDREKNRKYPIPNLTVKRSFTARNTGDVTIYVNGFFINSLPCEGYGFRVLNCEPLALPPNATRKIDIAFTPDFTLAKITRTLILETSLNYPVNYTLVTTVPPYYLNLCASILSRPIWEYYLYYIAICSMIFLLAFVIVAPLLESERILKEALVVIPRQNAQHTLDLRSIGAEIRTEMQKPDIEQQQLPKKINKEEVKLEETKKVEGLKYTALIPSTGKGKRKGLKRNDVIESHETHKKNWVEISKIQKMKSDDLKSADVDSNLNKKNIRKISQPKKIENKHIEVPNYEEETSSTTTDSSNTDENIKLTSSKIKAVKTETKIDDFVEATHFKLERRRSGPKNVTNIKAKITLDKIDTPKQCYTEVTQPTTKTKNKKERKEKMSNKKLMIEKSVKNTADCNKDCDTTCSRGCNSNSVSPAMSVSPSITPNVWGENKASFSDVVARSEPISNPPTNPTTNHVSTPITNPISHSARPLMQPQTAKPTMYVEPYKQQSTELGPIGSRKLDMWQDPVQNVIPREEFTPGLSTNNFFTEAHNLAVESSNAFLDFGAPETFPPSSHILNLIQGASNASPCPPLVPTTAAQGNPKDKVEALEKSGIYEIQCGGCDSKYVGQTRRTVSTRFKEHIAHYKYNRFEKSAVAQHILETSHPVEIKNVKVVKSIKSNMELNAYESIIIHKQKDSWSAPLAQTPAATLPPQNTLWDSVPYNPPTLEDVQPIAQPISPQSGYLWGSSSVWQPWTPPEVPRTPTRTPPGFAPHRSEEEERRQQTLNYNPFGISNIWTQQTNPWHYQQGP